MPKDVLICSGTMMEGLDIDIVKYCGIKTLTIEQYDTLHDEVSDLELVISCKHYHFNSHEDPDVVAADDDDFFYLATDNEDAFKKELRAKICAILEIT
jgi:hypothetical protein